MINFKGRHHPQDIILQCVRWYVAYAGCVASWPTFSIDLYSIIQNEHYSDNV